MLIDNISHQDIKTLNWMDTGSSTKKKDNDFFNFIKKALEDVSNAQNNAKNNTEDFTFNKPNISINDIIIDLEKASISAQVVIQARNKLVSAYQEIMNQQI